MFLNRLRSRLFIIRKISALSLAENRFTHLPGFDASKVAVFDIRKCEVLWKRYRNEDLLLKHVNGCFSRNGNSSIYISNVLYLACHNFSFSHELLYNFIKAYDHYINNNSTEFSLTSEQKMRILKSVLSYKNLKLIKLVCDVFKINDEQKSTFKEFISDLLEQERIAEAAYCISALDLHEEFPIEKIALLLLHENKWKTAMSFLKDCPDLQLATAKFLDGFLEKTVNPSNEISMRSRQASKALSSLVKTFKIPIVECKNLHFIRSKGAINLLIRRKNQQSISEAAWEEMVMKITGDNQSLKEHLLYKLMRYNDKTTAMKMKEKLNLFDYDLDSVPVRPSVDDTSKEIDETDDENENINEDNSHLTFNLSLSDIKFIDSKTQFKECVSDLSQNCFFIGIDTEWKPQFGLSDDRLSLIQLAGHNKVYILDTLALTNCLDTEDWDELIDKIFSNSKIVKLGCNLMTDIQMIVDNNRGTKGKTLRFTHILDMAIFYQKLQEVYPTEMASSDEDTQTLKGLSQLCKIILGKPLNKEVRLCDWEKRPLTDMQLEYAALDAHCLLQIYDELRTTSLERNLNFDHLAKVAMVLTTNHKRPKRKLKEGRNLKDLKYLKSLPIQQYKVVVHPVLVQLGKCLTELGADVLILKETDKASDAALIAETQGRVLICLDEFKKRVQNLFPDIICYGVKDFSDDKTFIEKKVYEILLWSNVQLEIKEPSYVCKICHNKEGIHVSSEDVNSIKREESKIENPFIEENKISNSTLLRTISDLKKSGVKLTFKNLSPVPTKTLYLCKKCGHIQ